MAKARQRQKHAAAPESGPKSGSAQMQQAWKWFEAGDKLSARRAAQAILASSPSEEDAQSARELLERLQIPRLAVMLGLGAAAVIVLLIVLAAIRT